MREQVVTIGNQGQVFAQRLIRQQAIGLGVGQRSVYVDGELP
jgi:hypothetical protein